MASKEMQVEGDATGKEASAEQRSDDERPGTIVVGRWAARMADLISVAGLERDGADVVHCVVWDITSSTSCWSSHITSVS